MYLFRLDSQRVVDATKAVRGRPGGTPLGPWVPAGSGWRRAGGGVHP